MKTQPNVYPKLESRRPYSPGKAIPDISIPEPPTPQSFEERLKGEIEKEEEELRRFFR